nr:putative ribonuclease H-like domain-containing protein [Tanacetum cinerariifolium]
MIMVLPPKILKEVVARERERKAKTILLMASPEDHLEKFHKMANEKEMWEAIKSRFGGNDESKKMQKFQTLLSQLEIHGVGVLHEDANQKFLRSLPSSWSQNVAFVSADNTSNTNDVSTAYSVSSLFVSKSQKEGSASYTVEVIHSFFANQSSAPQLDCDDLEKINDDELEEMDLKWQDSRKRDGGYNGNKARDNSQRPASQDDSKALVTIDEEAVDWSGHVEEDTQNFAMMAYSSKALKEKEDLKTKVENWQNSSKNLNRLLNTQMSANDKFGLGYGDYRYGSILSYENEFLQSVFMNKEYDLENTPVNDRYAEGMHTVPPFMTGNYMPSGPDVEIDYSKFTYGLKQTSVNESYAMTSENTSSDSDFSIEPSTSVPEPVVNESKVVSEPKAVSEPKVWNDAPIIEEYESDSDDDTVSNVKENIEKPSFAFTDTVKHANLLGKMLKKHAHLITILKLKRKIYIVTLEKNKVSNYNSGSKFRKSVKDPLEKKAHLVDYQEFKGGSVAFGGSNGMITGKGKIKAGRLDFKDVYYVEELKHYNLFSVSEMCDKKNKVLFTDTDCLMLSLDFKLPDENQVLFKIPRQHNMYSFNLNNIDPSGDLSCLLVKASIDEYNKCHRRPGHLNFKNLNKLMTRNLVRGLPSKMFENDHTCFACQKGKQHKASCKAKTAEAVNTACYVLNRVLVTKPQNKTPYEHLTGRQPVISYLRPFRCHVIILNTIDQLGKFDGKYDSGPKEANHSAGTEANNDQDENSEEIDLHDELFVLLVWSTYSTSVKSLGNNIRKNEKQVSQVEQIFQEELEKLKRQEKEANDAVRKEATHETQDVNTNSTNLLNAVSTPVSVVGPSRALNDDEPSYLDDPSMPHLEDIYASPSVGIFTNSSYDDEGVVTDFNNLETTMNVSPTPTTKIHTIHPKLKFLEILYQLFRQGVKIKAIRIFLAFVSYMGFIVYQMDVKSAFLYGTIDEEVYVTQPPRFVDPKFPNKVYRVVKALYGLHQAPRAWYATLSTFLKRCGYRRGAIYKNLFIKQDKKDIMLVQVYVDDIIFGSTKKSWCDEFEELMKNRFQMSSMGALTFFLGLQTASTPIETHKPLIKDEEDANVDVYLYKSMIGSLMYLTASRPDIMFAVCACSRFQVTPKTSHLQAVKRIFRYLKGQPKLVLWYPKASSFDLEAYLDNDYAGANLDRKSTTRCCQFLGRRLISWQCKKQTIMATSTIEAEYVAAAYYSALLKGRLLEVTTAKNSKELASAKQTALGKDESNLLIVDSLLKTIWSSMHHVIAMKHWLFQSKQLLFWSMATVKTVNDEVRVQTLIDGKKVTIKESSIRRTLRLDDKKVKTVNDEVRVQTLIDGKKVTIKESSIRRTLSTLVLKPPHGMNLAALWHQQSSVLPQTRSLTSLVDHQLGDTSHHQDIYDNPSLTKKVFANIKRVGTGFYGVITSLFENMLVSATEEVGQAQDDVSIPTEPSTSKPHKKKKSKKQQPIAPKVPSPSHSPEHQLPSPSNDQILTAKDCLTLQELMDLWTRLSNNVLDLESKVIDIKSSFTYRIQKLEDRVDQLEEENRTLKETSFKTTQVNTAAPIENMEKSFKQERMIANMDEDVEEAQAKAYNLDLQHAEKVFSMHDIDEEEPAEVEEVLEASAPKRRRGVLIQDPEETTTSVIVHSEVQSKDKGKGILIEEPKPLKGQAHIDMDKAFARQLEAELNANINWNDVVEQVKRSEKQSNEVMRYQALKRKPMTEAQGRKNMMIYLKNMASFKMNFFKGMTYSEIRPIFEKHYNSIQAFLEKVEEEVTVQEEGNKRQGESIEQDIAKKQRMDVEEKELKRHLQIMANDDDDVFTKATPLVSKVPVVDYQIHHENNKPYYKIIRVDGTHKLFLSFITLLKNFDREDLEALWKLVKERF